MPTPSLFNHCLRVYLWGGLLAARDRLRYDPELLYVGAALHDLGLTEAYAGRSKVMSTSISSARISSQGVSRGPRTVRAPARHS